MGIGGYIELASIKRIGFFIGIGIIFLSLLNLKKAMKP
jgi:hypothetical protein